MLEIRPNCENCGSDLPPDSEMAMICSFECTFCVNCVNSVLHNVCPNCGGGFVPRPIRPQNLLMKYPPSSIRKVVPVNAETFSVLLAKNRDIHPAKR